jgi:hypothetical protein
MKTTLLFKFSNKCLIAISFFAFMLINTTGAFAQVTVFYDDFNRSNTSPTIPAGGTPSVSYTSTTSGPNATIVLTASDATDFRIKMTNGGASTSATPAASGKDIIMSSLAGIPGYNPILNSNTGLVTWAFNMKHNKQSGTTLSGFDVDKYGVATILACNNSNPLATSANGFAVVMGGINTMNTYDLVYFSGGLSASANLTTIIQGIALTSFKDIVSIKVTYNPTTGKWNMFQKDEGSISSTTAFPDPYSIAVGGIGEVSNPANAASAVTASAANFGFLFNHKTEGSNSFYADNFKVVVGAISLSNFYLEANADCTDLSKWWSVASGTGSHPTNFTNDGQIFNIFQNGASISTDWTVSGAGSVVNLGDGTAANSMLIGVNGALIGKINVSTNATLRIENLVVPSLNIIQNGSTVEFAGADTQGVPSATYGNLSIFTIGNGATAQGSITVNGNLHIETGAIFSMSTYKLLGISSMSGAGSLKTKYSFTDALPAGNTWPFDVYYNYTSNNTTQTVALGSYKNLDLTGGPRKLPNDFSVSGVYNPGVDPLTVANTIDFNGTASQVVPAAQYFNIVVSNPVGAVADGVVLVSGDITGNNRFDTSAATIKYNSAASNQIISAGSFANNMVKNLIINNTFGVALQSDVKVTGLLTLQAGALTTSPSILTLVSNANGTAAVEGVDGTVYTGSIVGSVKVERFLSSAQRGWNLFGSPILDPITFANLSSQSTTPFDITYSNPSSKRLNNTTWSPVNTDTETWAFDSGIALFNRGIAGEGFHGSYTNGGPSQVTVSISGGLNLAQQSATTTSGQFYLVANPFAAPISLSAVMQSSTGLDGAVYIYDPTANSPINLQTMAGGFMTAMPSGAPGDPTDVVIPSLGAFIVKATSSGSVNIPVAAIYTGVVTPNTSFTSSTNPSSIGQDPDAAFMGTSTFGSTKYRVFPNPTSGTVNFESSSEIQNIEVLNMLGQTVASYKPQTSTSQIDTTSWLSGAYLVKVSSLEGTEIVKLIKK